MILIIVVNTIEGNPPVFVNERGGPSAPVRRERGAVSGEKEKKRERPTKVGCRAVSEKQKRN